MTRIENRARAYQELRGELADLIGGLNDEIDALTRQSMPAIEKLATRVAAQHASLKAAITTAPHLFQKPRTLTLHGIKCGFRKNEGRIEFDDPDLVVKKICQNFAAPAPYLRIVTQPNKEALATLPGADLKRLGCRIADTTDVVVIKPADSDLEKKINTFLKTAIEPAAK